MSERFRHAFVLAVVTALVLVSLVIVVGIPGVVKAPKTRLGLDLKGGTQLIYDSRTTNGQAGQLDDSWAKRSTSCARAATHWA
jgi:preprotein translocase subunit SecD